MSECMSKIFTRIDKMEQPMIQVIRLTKIPYLDACSNFNGLAIMCIVNFPSKRAPILCNVFININPFLYINDQFAL